MKNYWFYIDTYVHIEIIENDILFYNTLNSSTIRVIGNNKITKIAENLKDKDNLYVISLSEEELNDAEIRDFVNSIQNNLMGDLLDQSLSEKKPVQHVPVLNIQRDAEFFKNSDIPFDNYMRDYLKIMNIYINSLGDENKGYYKQFTSPSCSAGDSALEIEDLKKFFGTYKSFSKINITGSDILYYSRLNELISYLKESSGEINCMIYAGRIHEDTIIPEFMKECSINLFIDFPINECCKFKLNIEKFRDFDVKYTFIVSGEDDYLKSKEIIGKLGIHNYEFKPFYNGSNMSFFEENVFLEEDEITASEIEHKNVFARSVINEKDFGSLTILSSGDIYGNVNNEKLDSIYTSGIREIMHKEMYEGKSWRRVRKSFEPCNKCVYNSLCPSMSSYEFVMKRNNLCNIL